MKYKILTLLFIFLPLTISAETLPQRLLGNILLQVEQNGEAWYINPNDTKRYFLGRPADAFEIMKKFGIGITNNDLLKIEIGEMTSFIDYLKLTDTDSDGYNDAEEMISGYNPYGEGKIIFDLDFASKYLGKIFLQVEKNGEAWYINPKDAKRYFLGRPSDAFEVMRKLGIGITNVDLSTFLVGEIKINKPQPLPKPQPPEKESADQVMKNVGKAIIANNKNKTLSYFTSKMQKSINYSMDYLGSESKFTLGNILMGSKYSYTEDNKRVYTNYFYFQDGKVDVKFYLIEVGDSWKLDNL
ncbi:hypothetical protein KAI92_04035 [Candidatus Parcubacteria bacterium]|nr:hypothetical protein [Candidatus Parcubacteria bacterium]